MIENAVSEDFPAGHGNPALQNDRFEKATINPHLSVYVNCNTSQGFFKGNFDFGGFVGAQSARGLCAFHRVFFFLMPRFESRLRRTSTRRSSLWRIKVRNFLSKESSSW